VLVLAVLVLGAGAGAGAPLVAPVVLVAGWWLGVGWWLVLSAWCCQWWWWWCHMTGHMIQHPSSIHPASTSSIQRPAPSALALGKSGGKCRCWEFGVLLFNL
jgi:hypothetical protein